MVAACMWHTDCLHADTEVNKIMWPWLSSGWCSFFSLLSLRQTTVKESVAEEKLTPVVLAKQLAALKQQLVASHLEKLLGPDAAINLADPDGALAK